MKRIIAIALVCLLVFPLSVSATFSEQITAISFADMLELPADHWSNRAVYTMAALGVLRGTDGNFNPQGTTTRSEALAILMRGAGLEQLAERTRGNILEQKIKNPNQYNGVDSWADGYIRLAVDYGIISVEQYNDCMAFEYPYNPARRTFEKELPVTRLEFVEWFVRIFKLPMAERNDLITDYVDYKTVPEDKQLYVETALKYGLLRGDDSGLQVMRTISRQEVAQVLYNAGALLYEKMGITVKDVTVDSVFTETVSATETALVTETNVAFSDGSGGTYQRTYAVVGAAVDYTDYFDIDTDVLTLQLNRYPDGVHLLEANQEARLFYEGDKLLFITAEPADVDVPVETVDENYVEGEPITASLYYVDRSENYLVLSDETGMFEMPYVSGVTCSYRGTEVSLDMLFEKYLDYPVTVFSARSPDGSIYRVYHVQILKK